MDVLIVLKIQLPWQSYGHNCSNRPAPAHPRHAACLAGRHFQPRRDRSVHSPPNPSEGLLEMKQVSAHADHLSPESACILCSNLCATGARITLATAITASPQ